MKILHAAHLSSKDFETILSVLHAGGVIGFPTDTAYGLGADPFSQDAVAEIFRIKGRPETKPILLIVNSAEMAEEIALPSALYRKVARSFWPGPLTMVLRAVRHVPAIITAGTGTVGVRWPLAAFASELIGRFGKPITGTSANQSGQSSCVSAKEVQAQLGDLLSILIDAGELPVRGGSTLLDLTTDPPVVLREGPVSFEALHAVLDGNIRRHVA